ncbi:hypothetical protein [Prosthecochloris sp. ZM]|nr:hypothetical protein [Prosthecochloris sp. ZM]
MSSLLYILRNPLIFGPTCMAAGIAALDEISSKAADRSEEFM